MIDARFVPIEQWPGKPTPAQARKSTPFYASYNDTLQLLEKELGFLGAKEITIQAYFERHQIRNDGWPYSNARPAQPGVILQFVTRKKDRLSFPCDTFQFFETNLRAIALSLEALRKIDRYGVTRSQEQYKGWKQIEAPGAAPMFANKEEAAGFVSGHAYGFEDRISANQVLLDAHFRRAAYRRASARLHPDQPTGSHELFVRLQAAMAILDANTQ